MNSLNNGGGQCIVVSWQWCWGLCGFYLYLALNIEINSLILNKEKVHWRDYQVKSHDSGRGGWEGTG